MLTKIIQYFDSFDGNINIVFLGLGITILCLLIILILLVMEKIPKNQMEVPSVVLDYRRVLRMTAENALKNCADIPDSKNIITDLSEKDNDETALFIDKNNMS